MYFIVHAIKEQGNPAKYQDTVYPDQLTLIMIMKDKWLVPAVIGTACSIA